VSTKISRDASDELGSQTVMRNRVFSHGLIQERTLDDRGLMTIVASCE
jgi:hypothetical protein